MDRDEFLRTLREALSGEVAPNIIEENIRYYDAYIVDEVRKGRSEREVIEELGGARVIAKTIIDVAAAAGDAGTGDPYGDAYRENAYDSGNGYGGEPPYGGDPYGGTENGNGSRGPEPPRGFHVYNLDKWYWKLLFWVIIFAVLMLVMSLVMGLATLLWPILVIGLVIWMIRGLRR